MRCSQAWGGGGDGPRTPRRGSSPRATPLRRAAGAEFAPVVVADAAAVGGDVGMIEVRIGEALVRIPREADPRMAAAVIAALKAAR